MHRNFKQELEQTHLRFRSEPEVSRVTSQAILRRTLAAGLLAWETDREVIAAGIIADEDHKGGRELYYTLTLAHRESCCDFTAID